VKELLVSSLDFSLDPEKCHERLTLSSDRRSVVHEAESQESDYFAAALARQEVPMEGRHRYIFKFTNTSETPPDGYWGAISVVGSGYNINSTNATYDGMSEGFWSSNDGIGSYSDGTMFGLGHGFDQFLPLRSTGLDCESLFAVEVDRSASTVRFLKGGTDVHDSFTAYAQFSDPKISELKLWASCLVMRQGLGFRCVRHVRVA